MAHGQPGDRGVRVPEAVVEDHRDGQDHVPTPRQEMEVPPAKEELSKNGSVIEIAVPVRPILFTVMCVDA